MKKVKLSLASMQAAEILSRDQLKSIFGGSGGVNCDDTTQLNESSCTGKSQGDDCAFYRFTPDCKLNALNGKCVIGSGYQLICNV